MSSNGTRFDMTPEKAALALARHTEEFAALFDDNWECVWANDASRHVYGYEPNDVDWTSITSGVHPDDRANVLMRFADIANGRELVATIEYRLTQRDGHTIFVESRIVRAAQHDDFAGGVAVYTRDVTGRATLDHVTSLPNRKALLDRLSRLAESGHSKHAVLVAKIDRYGAAESALGPTGTEEFLLEMSRRLRGAVSAQIMACALDPGVFGVLVEGSPGQPSPQDVAQRVRQALSGQVQVQGRSHRVTASVGIAVAAGMPRMPEEMLRAAMAAHESTRRTHRPTATYDTTILERLSKRGRIESDLDRAIERDELEVYYQPLIDLTRDELAGFEALVRWKHPAEGMISPGVFIPIAEETGQIVAIGEWVLQQACLQMRRWLDAHPTLTNLKMSVNLSPAQITGSEAAERLAGMVTRAGVLPRNMKFELTESAFIDIPQLVQATLETLSERGFSLALDDFGTGFSSLSHLRNFPFDTIKVDRSFVMNMLRDEGKSKSLVASVIRLGQTLGMAVIAEGVEERAQRDILLRLGCDYAQGYLFGRPMPSADATAQVEALVSLRARQSVARFSRPMMTPSGQRGRQL